MTESTKPYTLLRSALLERRVGDDPSVGPVSEVPIGCRLELRLLLHESEVERIRVANLEAVHGPLRLAYAAWQKSAGHAKWRRLEDQLTHCQESLADVGRRLLALDGELTRALDGGTTAALVDLEGRRAGAVGEQAAVARRVEHLTRLAAESRTAAKADLTRALHGARLDVARRCGGQLTSRMAEVAQAVAKCYLPLAVAEFGAAMARCPEAIDRYVEEAFPEPPAPPPEPAASPVWTPDLGRQPAFLEGF